MKMNKAQRGFLKRSHYSNIIILSIDGKPLSTISTKKARWYLKKGLAKMLKKAPHPYSQAIQLKFQDKSDGNPEKVDLCICDNKCVVCGRKTLGKLSLHHVIPYVLRKHFPVKYKIHSREWCVLLCLDCHDNAERLTQPLYMQDFPQAPRMTLERTNGTLQLIKDKGNIHRLSPHKLKFLLKNSSYKNVDEIPSFTKCNQKDIHTKISNAHHKEIKRWAKNFVKKHGGIKGTKKYFSEIFLQMNPKYLPDGYIGISKNILDNNPKIR
jgi:hypothetical protein